LNVKKFKEFIDIIVKELENKDVRKLN
jgi:hypothetical protein